MQNTPIESRKVTLVYWRLVTDVWSLITLGAFWGKTIAWQSCVGRPPLPQMKRTSTAIPECTRGVMNGQTPNTNLLKQLFLYFSVYGILAGLVRSR